MGNYFEGWYFKCQKEDKTLALIPARHRWLYGGAGGDSLPGNGIPPCLLSGGKGGKDSGRGAGNPAGGLAREAPAGHLLRAPEIGAMHRLIRESPGCDAFYSFRVKGRTLFSFATGRASFAFAYP